ncbi:MAG: hypothetical protein ACF8GE_11845 [Phycisphaerales bacterium JB043]
MSRSRTISQEDLVRASALASTTERSNRSVTMLAIAIVFCLVSIFSTIAIARASSNHRGRLEARVAQQEQLLRLEAQLHSIEQRGERNSGASQYPPETQLRAKLDRISSRLGLSPPANLGNMQNRPLGSDSPLVNTMLDVTITNAMAQDGLRWLELAQQEIRGLQVMSLEMRPTNLGWTFRIQLGRWEARR